MSRCLLEFMWLKYSSWVSLRSGTQPLDPLQFFLALKFDVAKWILLPHPILHIFQGHLSLARKGLERRQEGESPSLDCLLTSKISNPPHPWDYFWDFPCLPSGIPISLLSLKDQGTLPLFFIFLFPFFTQLNIPYLFPLSVLFSSWTQNCLPRTPVVGQTAFHFPTFCSQLPHLRKPMHFTSILRKMPLKRIFCLEILLT